MRLFASGLRVRPAVGVRLSLFWFVVAGATLLAGCGDVNVALERVSEARRLSADLLVEFTTAADAANRAVMADTDDSSVTFAREAEQAIAAVQRDADTLTPILANLGFSPETDLLEDFRSRFAEYRTLDRNILDLAVENTNIKAQQLSFGPARAAVDALRAALEGVKPSTGSDQWQVRAWSATVVANARDIEASEAPHIAEAGEPVMADIEARMKTSETASRDALKALAEAASPASKPQLAAANAAFDKLMEINGQIISLSRRNTNVRSLALSLNQKRAAINECESRLRALRDALAKRGYTGIR